MSLYYDMRINGYEIDLRYLPVALRSPSSESFSSRAQDNASKISL